MPLIKKIVGASWSDFEALCVNNGQDPFLSLRPARLIPLAKFGDEIALTSVFLSALRLVKEFRESFFKDIDMPTSGKIHVFTEVAFPNSTNRIDGMILVSKGGVIKDAALLEMKKGTTTLEEPQIEQYIQLAKVWGIPRLVTVSNEFVLHHTQTPLRIKPPKDVSLFHFSWTAILTIAHLLLFKDRTSKTACNINDEDQIEIMREVVGYLESNGSGVCGYTRMKDAWKKTVEAVVKEATLNEVDLNEAVSSWYQEAKDMALLLSRELGVLVRLANAKTDAAFVEVVRAGTERFRETKQLSAVFKIKDAASDLAVVADAKAKTVKMSVSLNAPKDKKAKGQIGWLKKQIESCKEKAKRQTSSTCLCEKDIEELFRELRIFIVVKHAKFTESYSFRDLNEQMEVLKDKEITRFDLVWIQDFGRDFAAQSKFVERIESMLICFYAAIAQNLTPYTPPAPKIKVPSMDATPDTPEVPAAVEPVSPPLNTQVPASGAEIPVQTEQGDTSIPPSENVIHFDCQHCNQPLQAPFLWSKRELNCPVCAGIICVP